MNPRSRPCRRRRRRRRRRGRARTYDLLATADFFCDHPEVDCDRLCFTGTSNGGSILVHYLHRHLDATFATFFEDDAADLTPIPYVPLPVDRPLPRFAQAISPGCGLRGAIGLESDEADLPAEPIEDLYYPAAPLYLNIGDDDSVPDECTTEVPGFAGTRQIQATEVEAREAIAAEDSLYRVEVHADGEHDLLGGPYGDAIRASLLQRAKDAFE